MSTFQAIEKAIARLPDPVVTDEHRAAARVVTARHATGPCDLAQLLDQLGLLPEREF